MNRRAEDFKQSFNTLVRKEAKVDERQKLLSSLLKNPEFVPEMEAADVAVACTASPFTIKGNRVIFASEEMKNFLETVAKADLDGEFVSELNAMIIAGSKDPIIASILRCDTTEAEAEVEIDEANPLDIEEDDDSVSEPGSLFDPHTATTEAQ